MKFTTLDDWLDWQASLNPAEIDLGLERISHVLKAMGHADHFSCPLIMVAGTNGKGSVVALLDAISSQSGLNVCCYTSPHILRYNERIRVAGQEIDDDSLCQSFQRVDDARDEVPLTYFEFGTLAAIDIFMQASADLVIMEVGLGGRLDAVNIMQPDVSVITSIDIDHVDWLGDTRELIAREKAGIMRSAKACICGDRQPPASLLERAGELSAELWVLGRDYEVTDQQSSWGLNSEQFSIDKLPAPALHGQFQRENAATAIAALKSLSRVKISDDVIRSGLQSVRLRGRFEILSQQPLVIADVAHNIQAVSSLVEQLKDEPVSGETRIVIAMLKDKPVNEVIECLKPLADYWYSAGLEREPRGLTAVAMAAAVEQGLVTLHAAVDQTVADVKLHPESTVDAAIKGALNDAGQNDRIVILGSFYTVAAAIDYFS